MSTHTSHITFTDQFCGAGGSSQGVRRFAERSGLGNGIEVSLALNHWQLAIDTHQHNFPDTQHDCTDIQACDPRFYPKTTILITSPECTNHSVAKGRKQVKAQLDAFASGERDAAAERSRATMWDVVRFSEYHRYKIVITENVVDARAWELWEPWLLSMHRLGYLHECVFFNSMFAWPTPQSRDRMYVVFWLKGQPKPDLNICPKAPCPTCGVVDAVQRMKPKANAKAKYGTQYTYVCPRCAKDVMPFYYAAINAIDFSLPAERIGDRKTPLKERTMARIKYGLEKYGRKPLTLTNYFSSGVACRVKDASEDPLFTQHGKAGTAVVSPFLLNMRGTSDDKIPHSTEGLHEALGTLTQGLHHSWVSPFQVGTEYDDAKRAKGMDEPLPGQTGRATSAVVMPFTLDSSFTKAGGEYMNGGDEPMGTQTTTQSKGVAIPPALMVSLNYPEQQLKGIECALDTVTGSRALAVAMAAPVDGMDSMLAGGAATPFMASMRGTTDGHVKSSASGLDEPMGTVSAGGYHHALVSGRAMGFLAPYYGQHGGARLDDAIPTLRTKDSHALITGSKPLQVEDLYFRMLKPHEVKAGMAFDRDYTVLGNGREQVKQLGNAVTPPVMEILVERCVASLM